MKKTMILVYLINIALGYSQNIEPSPIQFCYPFSNATIHGYSTQEYYTLDASLEQFKQKEFVAGWWWGFNIADADNMNSNISQHQAGSNAGYGIYEVPSIIDINAHPNYSIHSKKPNNDFNKIKLIPGPPCFPYFGISMQFEPTLQISDPYVFHKVAVDEGAHSIFGFIIFLY